MEMCLRSNNYIPYVCTSLLLFICFPSISTQNYGETSHFKTKQRFIPAPVYPDSVDYADNNQYDYVGAPQSDALDRNTWSIAHQPQLNVNAAIKALNYTPVWVPDWPSSGVTLGQVSAVAMDNKNRVVVFHRATRVWDRTTFNEDNRYWNSNEVAIDLPTIAIFNSSTGILVEHWGQNMFYMPHGLTVDSKNNIWVTDVALHQVMRFTAGQRETPSLTLGVRFTPGNDDYHFCKPSGVAVMTSGVFFVSDGYCNTRVIKYSAEGKKILQWGRNSYHGAPQVVAAPYAFTIPHALALAEDKGLICVADRENGRIQCFHAINGTFVSQFHSPVMGNRLYSVAYSPINGGQLYVVNGREYPARPIRGFVIDITTRKILSQFGPNNKDFANPHDIAVTKDGKQIYVVELDPYKVHKFIDYTIVDEKVDKPSKAITVTLEQVTTNKSVVTSTATPVKPTATIEGLPLVGNTWGGWAGVAGGVAGGLGAVLLLLLGGAALLLKARHRGGTKSIPETESLVDDC